MVSDSTCIGQTDTPEETKRLAEKLAVCLHPGDVILMNGDLGAGKTQFVQGTASGNFSAHSTKETPPSSKTSK